MTTGLSILIVLTSLIFSVSAQLLLKSATQKKKYNQLNFFDFINSVMLDTQVWLGTTLLFASLLFWLIALKNMPLSFAYPITSLSIVLVLIGSYLFLGENLKPQGYFGVGVIISGVLILYFSES